MYVDQMRKALEDVYPVDRWLHKVSRMSDEQVMAVYYRFLYDGRFDKASRERFRPRKTSSVASLENVNRNPCKKKNIDSGDFGVSEGPEGGAHQVTVFDILRENNLKEGSSINE